jgi:hypothetical protein
MPERRELFSDFEKGWKPDLKRIGIPGKTIIS